MQINSNLNAMMQLEKKLEQSANALAKMNMNSEDSSTKQQKNVRQQHTTTREEVTSKDADLTQEIVTQNELALVYGVNGNVISVQNAAHQTTLDIKA